MHELREHPYILVGGGIAVVLVIGAVMIAARTSTPVGGTSGWGSATPLTTDDTLVTSSSNTHLPAPSLGTTTTPPFIPLSAANPSSDENDAQFDMSAFLAQLSTPPPKQGSSTSGGTPITDAYSFIPTGLISTTSFALKTRTPADQALYDYGNEAGSYIGTYDDANRNAPVIMKAQIEDRQDPAKAEAVRAIGRALASVGHSLQGIESVPPIAASYNAALAQAYIDIGAKLQKVPDAQRDSDLVAAIEAYDSAVDDFNKKYIAVASIFSASGVSFQPQDPGSVFTFSQNGGL